MKRIKKQASLAAALVLSSLFLSCTDEVIEAPAPTPQTVKVDAGEWKARQDRIEELEKAVKDLNDQMKKLETQAKISKGQADQSERELRRLRDELQAAKRVIWRQLAAMDGPRPQAGKADPVMAKLWPRIKKDCPNFIAQWELLIPGFGPQSMKEGGEREFKIVNEWPAGEEISDNIDEMIKEYPYDLKLSPNKQLVLSINGGDDCARLSYNDIPGRMVKMLEACNSLERFRVGGFWLSNDRFVTVGAGPSIQIYDLTTGKVATWSGPSVDEMEYYYVVQPEGYSPDH